MQVVDTLGFERRPGDDSVTNEDKALLLEALQIGRECAYEAACEYHEKMKGYRRVEHELMDADVALIDRAIELIGDINATK